MKKIGLALGGGGARGFSHIPFLQVFDDLKIKPAVLSGTSIGAIIGALYADGTKASEIVKLLREVDLLDITKMVDLNILNIHSLIKGKGIENFLRDQLKATTFEELNIPLKIVATDFWRQSEVIIDSGDLIQAIRATISIPAIFEPIKLEDQVLVDGGISNPVPYDIIRSECDVLVAIDVSGTMTVPQGTPLPNMFENVMASSQILQKAIVSSKLQMEKPDFYLKPELPGIRILDFEKAEEIMACAALDAVRFKKSLKKELGVKSRFRIFGR